jgi:hypothetical protein
LKRAGLSEFNSQKRQEHSFLQNIQTGSQTHPAYLMDSGGFLTNDKFAGA